MTTSAESLRVLSHALDQAGDVLDHVRSDRLPLPTPCAEWDVAALADHLVNAPRQFAKALRGEQPDWGAPAPHLSDGWGPAFRVLADDLIHAWHETLAEPGAEPQHPPEMECAEIGVHTWDLATALGLPPVASLDPAVAEAALGFMQAALTPELRGPAFAAELPAPDGAGAYERLAAFAGRSSG